MKLCFGAVTAAQQARYEAVGLPKNTRITRYTTDILPARTNVAMSDFLAWHRRYGLPQKLEQATTTPQLEDVIEHAVNQQLESFASPPRQRETIEHGGSVAVDVLFHLERKTPLTVSDPVFDRVLSLVRQVKTAAEQMAASSR